MTSPRHRAPGAPTCLICGTSLKVALTTSKKGKVAVGLSCPVDGRHFRGFVNDRDYVTRTIQATQALQNPTKTGDGAGADQ